MFGHRLSIAITILALVIISLPVQAQQNGNTTSQEETAKLREKAFRLLASLAGQVGSLQSPQNRARIASNIADSIWEHDEAQARALFAAVETEIRTNLGPTGDDSLRDVRTFNVFLKLRADTIERIAKHDGQLAFEFYKATEPGSNSSMGGDTRQSERNLEALMAKRVAAANPAMAVELGRKLLKRDRSAPEIPQLLRRINRWDKEQGRTFIKVIVETLRDTDFPSDWSERRFSRELFYSVMPTAPDDSAFRDIFDLFVKRARADGCDRKTSDPEFNSFTCSWFGSMVNTMEQVDPARAAPFKRWPSIARAEAEKLPAPYYFDYIDLVEARNIDELLLFAPKYPLLAEDMQWRAFSIALGSGDLERTRKIAADFKGSDDLRKRMLSEIESASKPVVLDEEAFAEMEKMLASFPSVFQSGPYLANFPGRIARNNREKALKLLDQMNDRLSTLKPGREQLEGQLLLAKYHCSIKSDRGMAMMESVITRLNELVDAAVKLDSYDTRYLADGEWGMSAEGPLGSTLTRLANNASYFAWCDFDRAVSAAAQFDRNEIRMMAQLKLAQGILEGRPVDMLRETAPR